MCDALLKNSAPFHELYPMLILSFLLTSPALSKILIRELLFQNQSYNLQDSPYDINGETVTVKITVTYVVLAYVEENRQIVSYILNIEYVWMDPRLAYDEELIGEPYCILPSNVVWIPMVDCYNCMDVHNMDMESQSNEVRIWPNGTVKLIQKAAFDTICRTEIAAFPFDTQYCGIYFDAGLSDSNRLIFDPQEVGYDLVGTPEWMISFEGTWVNNTDYTLASITFKLIRNSEFYIIFLILPTMVVTSVSLAAILLPLRMSQGEKINMGITGLLGLTFLLGIIVQEVPRSKKLPVLGQWLIVEMFICIMTLVLDTPLKDPHKMGEKILAVGFRLDSVLFLLFWEYRLHRFDFQPNSGQSEYFSFLK